ncbi:endonuclease/exonuclease/phosphatase family protein [Endozoicomonas numazuensis]|uniref:Endonuclease n=1 Tax=Endozoicomonas numazuensis TaxID=1137799 RepID=A0A081NDX1_9GAMM|nr:endonuclease/exonuclease/phosphatase family protein [Endozoicomonas numazuensis]KEQ16644.1 endonuclease [Endozoicomonas numazuensis]
MPIRTLKGALSSRLNRDTAPRSVHCSELVYKPSSQKPGRIRLLSFNIQVGINTQQYRHYLTRSWQHLLPNSRRSRTLDQIAAALPDFDLVALQEADGGSLRTGFINQTEYLAQKCQFPYWYQQLNRNLGKLAQHSNGLLSRFKPTILEDHKLPGLIPGRGAIVAQFGDPQDPLVVVMMHLALSQRARNIQLSYIRDLVSAYNHVVLMGDMNTHADQLLNNSPLSETNLHAVHTELNTFPSWRPSRSLDHILVSRTLKVHQVGVLNLPISDHLPVAVEVEVPESVHLE